MGVGECRGSGVCVCRVCVVRVVGVVWGWRVCVGVRGWSCVCGVCVWV